MARAARLDPDTLPSLIVAVILTATLGAVSFTLSFSGLVEVAAWASVPDYLAWTVPVTVDASILVYTLAVFIFRARGESNVGAWTWLIMFTLVSVAANAAHAWDASVRDWHGYAGAALSGLAPVSVLLTTHTLGELIVAKPEHRASAARSRVLRAAERREAAEQVDVPGLAPSGTVAALETGVDGREPVLAGMPGARPGEAWDLPEPVGVGQRTAALDAARATTVTAPVPPAVAAEQATAAVQASTPRPRTPRPDMRLGSDLGEQILDLRAKGETLNMIADTLGVSRATVSRRLKEYHETGAIPVVTPEQIAAAAR